MTRSRYFLLLLLLLCLARPLWPQASAADSPHPPESFLVSPPAVSLRGNLARAQLIVIERDSSGRLHAGSADLTREADYRSTDPAVVTVNSSGKLMGQGNGTAAVAVTVGGIMHQVAVDVSGVEARANISFDQQIVPIISKAGCNQGACHAAQHGQAGFKLSVFGFEPANDWQAITRERLQRRVDYLVPARSLLLEKPTLATAHGGGKRLDLGSIDYQILLAWIAGGTPGPSNESAKVTGLKVTPWGRAGTIGLEQQLRVEARYSDGTTRDVTGWAKYDSMDDGVIQVTEDGLVRAVGQGQAPLMVRFEGQAEVAMFVIPYAETVNLVDWQSHNFVDEFAVAKFRELGIEPSPVCDDATFIRRAMLDAIGTLPTPDDTLAFLGDNDPAKRERLVDRLLGLTGDPDLDVYNDQYAAFWTLKWSDLIRNTSKKLGDQGMWAMHNWIKESFRANKPFDEFVRELVTAKGSIYSNGPANYFRLNGNADDLAEATAQLFLGVRLECAKCHHHPFEKYSQGDYYGLAAFFSRVGTKNSQEFGLFGGEQVVMVRASGEVSHPRTRQQMQPTPLDGEPVDHPLDRRIALADWLAAPDNEFFARSVVNRYMAYLLGRGLVDPIDDIRSTNPPSNVALMDALAKDFAAGGFDLKHLIRTIMTSRLYQLSSQPTISNAADTKFYSHFKVKRLTAEPLLDAVDRVTGAETKFSNLPPGTRAIELPDAEYSNYFLNVFAKPRRASVCECERPREENLSQALHTLNGDTLAGKITSGSGRVARLLESQKPHEEIVEALYLAALCRPPTQEEQTAAKEFLDQSPSPKECYEDLLWALINSKQFLYVR